MIFLFKDYCEKTELFLASLKETSINIPIIHLSRRISEDNIISPFSFYIYSYPSSKSGNPLPFYDLTVPPFWEINTITGVDGEIISYGKVRANIIFLHIDKRTVSEVRWLNNEDNKLLYIDYYNKFGWRYLRSIVDENENPTINYYYNKEQQEIIVENLFTKSILLNDNNKTTLFSNEDEFFSWFLENNFSEHKILFNDINIKKNILENNDWLLLYQNSTEPHNIELLNSFNKVFISDYSTFLYLKDNTTLTNIYYLGYPIPSRKPSFKKEAFVLTNSELIDNIENLIIALPDVVFNIAAFTFMGANLVDLEKYNNVKLYPNVSTSKINELLERCSLYLDINHYDEMYSIVTRSYFKNLLILSWEQTVHNRNFIADKNIFDNSNYENMVTRINTAFYSKEYFNNLLTEQHKKTNGLTVQQYLEIIGENNYENL